MGVRFQRLFISDRGYGWMREVFAGLEIICPTLGAGIRYGTNPWLGQYNAVSISTGADFYWLLVPNLFPFFSDGPALISAHMIAFDTDIIWNAFPDGSA